MGLHHGCLRCPAQRETSPWTTLTGASPLRPDPQAINTFCREMGVTRSDNLVRLHKLEHHVRGGEAPPALRLPAAADSGDVHAQMVCLRSRFESPPCSETV